MLGKHLLHQLGPSIPVGEKWTFTSNGSWEAPAKGNYKITLVGAGGIGGAGLAGGMVAKGGGGGGGAGQTIVQTHTLTRNTKLTITIGQPNSGSSKVSGTISLTANGGDPGGDAYKKNWMEINGGSVAAKYGSGGSGGSQVLGDFDAYGGSGKTSDYGQGYGRGGVGQSVNRNDELYGRGNGTAGICVIEYIGM